MFLISGAGISGLIVSTLLVKDKICLPEEIIVVESSDSCGGLYKPWISSNLGELDKGMHIYYETLINEIDSLVFNSIPANEWYILENNFKDVAGAFFNKRLQVNSPYPDLRYFKTEIKNLYISEFINHIDTLKSKNNDYLLKFEHKHKSAKDYWTNRFGDRIYENVFNPICKKLYGNSGDKLSKYAAYYTKLDRIILFCDRLMEEISKSTFLRKVLAYPEQLQMPNFRANNQRGLYPKNGMTQVVESLYEKLLASGVKFMLNSEVVEIQKKDKKYNVNIKNKDKDYINICFDNIFWSGNRISLARAMKIKSSYLPSKGESNYIFCRIKEENLKMKDLYYFYCLDSSFSAFRVSNISKYAKNIDSNGRMLLCIEQHLTEEQLKDLDFNKNPQKKVINELLEMGIINCDINENMLNHFKIPKRVFPNPLLNERIHQDLTILDNLENIIFPGKGYTTSQEPFFLVDSLKNIYFQYENLFN